MEATLDLQNRLIAQGLLDPPADGIAGVQTSLAANLLATLGGTAPAVDSSANDLACAVWRAMLERGYWLARVPGYMNIVYVEGANPDGSPNENAPNEFNDLRLVLTVRDGAPVTLGAWQATTEPGRSYTEHPMSPGGAARIAFGQYKAWVVGMHGAGTPGAHEALVQAGPVRVYRDLNRDYRREGDTIETSSTLGLNQHWGYDLPSNDIGKASAGCLVGRSRAGHKRFMQFLKQDPRYQANPAGYRFMTAILTAADLRL